MTQALAAFIGGFLKQKSLAKFCLASINASIAASDLSSTDHFDLVPSMSVTLL